MARPKRTAATMSATNFADLLVGRSPRSITDPQLDAKSLHRFPVRGHMILFVPGESGMPNFVIEREIPGASQMTEEQVRSAAQGSLAVLKDLGPQIQWLHSYVTDDKVYCIYWAPDADMIREHAKRVGIPANRISAVKRLMQPASAE